MEQIEDRYDFEMFKIFASLHPVEAYDLDREYFIIFFKEESHKDLTDSEIDNLIEETR
jgi:hypothetical protein